MRAISIIALSLACTSPLCLMAKTTLNLEVGGTANYQERKYFRHSLKCYWKGKAPENYSHGTKSATATLGTDIYWNTSKSISVNNHYKYNYALSNARITTKKTRKGDKDVYSLSLNTSLSGHKSRRYEKNKCNHKDMEVSPTSGYVKGQINMEIPFVSESWLTEITVSSKEGVFNSESLEFFNDAINAKFFIADDKFYVWAKPGSKLNVKINLEKTPFENQKLGGITFGVRSVAEIVTSAKAVKIKIDQAIRDFRSQNLKPAIVEMASVMASINSNDQIVREIATNVLFDKTRELYSLAHAVEGDAETLLNAKTMAALLSYELTMQLFEDLTPYCGNVDIDSRFSESRNSVLGLRAAHFWTYRALLALKHFDYSALDALLEQMASFELNQWSYKYVMQNKDYQKKLDKAYNLLLQQFDFSASPFTRALIDVEQLVKHFPSIGASDSNSEKIFELLKEGAKMEDEFMNKLHRNFYNYKKQSTDKIQILPIIGEKQYLDKIRKDIINKMITQIRFLSIDDEDQQNNFLAKVTQGLLHQVNIFSTESNIELIENIRASFLVNPQESKTIKTMTSCILGEDNES